MVVHDVLRRRIDVRACEECDETVTVNAETAEATDQHHVVAFTDGSGDTVSTEYATYIFCSLSCLKEWTDAYFQRMLEPEQSDDISGSARFTTTEVEAGE